MSKTARKKPIVEKKNGSAIEMAEMVVDSTNQEVSTLANAIIATQKEEIQRMKELLSR